MFEFYGSYKASFSHPGEVNFLAGQGLNIFSLVIIYLYCPLITAILKAQNSYPFWTRTLINTAYTLHRKTVRKISQNDSLKQKWRYYYKGDMTELCPRKNVYLQVVVPLKVNKTWSHNEMITNMSSVGKSSVPSIFRYAVITSCSLLIVSNNIDPHNFSLDDVLQINVVERKLMLITPEI